MTRLMAVRSFLFAVLAVMAATLVPTAASARVARVEVTQTSTLRDKAYGKVGTYRKYTGRVDFAFDPASPANARITDLSLAPRDAKGLVHASANFVIYQPADPARRSGLAIFNVPNRGHGGKLDPLYAARGFTVVWMGWEFDVRDGPDHLLRLDAPPVRNPDGSPLHGLVRSDWIVELPTRTLSLGHHRGSARLIGYPVSNVHTQEAYLTVRDDRNAPRRLVPRSQWRFARATPAGVVDDTRHIYMKQGFTPGKIYELVYPSDKPVVVGVGLAAIRDMMSYLKYDPHALFPVKWGIATGYSQDGRLLRHFMYQGFNADTRGRKVFDGIMAMAGGAGRGSFNHRFAQPSRDGLCFSAFFYPSDLFPFTGRAEHDPVTGRTDGLLIHMPAKYLPKIFYTASGFDYWCRNASLIHTSVDGRRDIKPLPNVRIYHIAGTQHVLRDVFPPTLDTRPDPGAPPGRLTAAGQPAAWRGDPVNGWWNIRALTLRLADWVVKDRAPPPSQIPHVADGTLVTVKAARKAFPDIPGITFPHLTGLAYRADYGPRWKEGIIDRQPPILGKPFTTLVPVTDALGNELGGIRNVELRVPLATYTPWSLRKGMPGPQDELADFRGSFIPLPWDAAQKKRTHDPRPAVMQLYRSRADYMRKVRAAVHALVRQGFALPRDAPGMIEQAGRTWDWLAKRAGHG